MFMHFVSVFWDFSVGYLFHPVQNAKNHPYLFTLWNAYFIPQLYFNVRKIQRAARKDVGF